jgi:hypothetical protein
MIVMENIIGKNLKQVYKEFDEAISEELVA